MNREILQRELDNKVSFNIDFDQENFLNSNIGKIVDGALEIGIRKIFPDFLENSIIKIKDNIFESGVREGIGKTIKDTIEVGKNLIGIFKGEFKDINQIKSALDAGGIINNISLLIDYGLDKSKRSNLISNNILKKISNGKNIIINTVDKNIKKMFENQINQYIKINDHMEKWKNEFKNKNYEGIKKEYKKINDTLENMIPINKIVKNLKIIDNLQQLIESKGENFEISNEELELAQKLM